MALAVYITNARDAIEVVIVSRAAQEVVLVGSSVKNALPIRPVGYTSSALPVRIGNWSSGVLSDYFLLGTLGGDFLGLLPDQDVILVTGV